MRFVVALLVALAIAVLAPLLRLALRPPGVVQASGTIEVTQADVAPKVQGRLLQLFVKDGAAVRRGQTLALLEERMPSLSVDQAKANVEAAVAQVAAAKAAYDLERSTYPSQVAQAGAGVAAAQSNVGQAGESLAIEQRAAVLQVDQAQAQLASAQSAYDHARASYVRARSLVGSGDEPQQLLDDATAQYRAARAQVRSASDAVALALANRRNVRIREFAVSGSQSQQRQSAASLESVQAQSALVEQRKAQLLAAQSQLAQARAALGLARENLSETRLLAPFDGYVISHNFEAGDLIVPGAPVLTVGDLEHPYVYVYVSETQLPRIKPGLHADVTVDGFPNRRFDGVVTEIGNTAEFTPENVQTKDQRIDYLVFRVKVEIADKTRILKPGLPADAAIRLRE